MLLVTRIQELYASSNHELCHRADDVTRIQELYASSNHELCHRTDDVTRILLSSKQAWDRIAGRAAKICSTPSTVLVIFRKHVRPRAHLAVVQFSNDLQNPNVIFLSVLQCLDAMYSVNR
jgi:hypothetical protein